MPTIDEIQNDVACPACQYNLRGLRGAVVNCPECGRECDIAEIIRRRWDKPWYLAPGMNTVNMPVAVAVASCIVLPMFRLSTHDGGLLGGLGVIVFPMLALVVWGAFLYRAWLLFDSAEGVGLALLAHVILAVYLAGVVAVVFTIATVFSDDLHYLLVTLPVIGLGVLGRVGERFIAGRCIRRYLNRPPGS